MRPDLPHHPQLCEAEHMQYPTPDPFHDRRTRLERIGRGLDRLIAVLIIMMVAGALIIGAAAWAGVPRVSVWASFEHETPVNP